MDETTRSKPYDPAIIDAIDQLIRQLGGDPEQVHGLMVREILQTGLRLLVDGADTGEVKLLNRSLRELRYALKVFRPYRSVPKVSIFGSARTPVDHPNYRAAADFARAISGAGWMVITGAGDGIMGAGHAGAGREASFGVGIRLPFETSANDVIAGDSKMVTFRYFFTRKLMFLSQANAVALFPGGFGTHDEGFEVLTLIQTGKSPLMPVVMVDSPGGEYWKNWDRYVRDHLLAAGLVSPEDLNLYHIFDDPAAAAEHVLRFYRVYHSQRYVEDRLVLRIKRKLTTENLEALNGEFADLLANGGKIEQTEGPVEGEGDFPELPRLVMDFTRRSFGRLRVMLDRVNQM